MLLGHEDKYSVFKKIVAEDALGHAYLFFGDDEIGKASFANEFAYFLEFNKFTSGKQPFIDTLMVAPTEGTIGIDTIREIKAFLWQTPLRSPRRLAIIDTAERLTEEAQSALLKIVEDPPPHTLLIFIAHDPQIFFPPLRSRLSKIYFSRLPQARLKEILVSEYEVEEKEAFRIAGESFGRMGRALRLMKKKPKKQPAKIKGKEKEKDLIEEIDGTILQLWRSDPVRNVKVLSRLLRRSALLKRFNLNENLQRKAYEYEIHTLI